MPSTLRRSGAFVTAAVVVFAAVLLPVELLGQAPAPGARDGSLSIPRPRNPTILPAEDVEAGDAGRDYALDILRKMVTDSIYRAEAPGAYEFLRFSYPSSVGDLDIPAYLFKPLAGAYEGIRPALVLVHGGVHADWSAAYLPFVKDAVARGYIVIAPDYRGSTGYGQDFTSAIDYGGYEIDDVLSAFDYLRDRVPEADAERVGIMGWSHGGFIAAHTVFRDDSPFRAAAAIAPVSNLIFRLSYKGPAYQALFSAQPRIGGLPHEVPEVYVERSPLYRVDRLSVPFMVHVATNDSDVDFVEAQMLVDALQARKSDLAEVQIYDEPPGGHLFSRLVDLYHRPILTPAMIDTWARTWNFFDRHLQGGAAVAQE